MRRSAGLLCATLLAVSLTGGCGGSGKKDEASSDGKQYVIAVIPKGTTHEFWKAVHAGAIKAERELGNVKVEWKGSLKEDDREEQVQVVETFIASRVDAIVLAPLDDRALVLPVRDAKAQGIPTVVIDSGLQGEEHVAFVATDNYKGGTIAAERLAQLTGGKAKLIVLRYLEGSASTNAREAGFLDTIKKNYPGIEILSDNQYAGATTESAYTSTENLLNRYEELTAFFCPNESSTFGALRALKARNLTKKIVFVGFDSSTKLVEALRAGEIQGLVIQNPVSMGYYGVKTAYAQLTGAPVEKIIDTGVVLATPENMDEPEISALLTPDFSAYLE